jgi:hypothetical protein
VLEAEGGGGMKKVMNKTIILILYTVAIILILQNRVFAQKTTIYECTSDSGDSIRIMYKENDEHLVTSKNGSKFNILPGIVHGYGEYIIQRKLSSKSDQYEMVVFQDYNSTGNSFFALYTHYDACGAISIAKDDRGYILTMLQSWAPLGDRVIAGRCEKIE